MSEWILQNAIVATLLTFAVTLFVRVFRPRPSISHILWLLVLVKLLVPPLSISGWPPWPVRVKSPAPVSSAALALDTVVPTPPMIETRAPDPIASSVPESAPTRSARPFPWTPVLATAWLLGGLLVGAFFAWRTRRFRNALSAGPMAPSWLEDLVSTEAAQFGLRAPPIRVVHGIQGPQIDPIGRARILWPAERVTDSDPVRWRAVVRHELAHLRRRDHWVLWIELAGAVLWWWLPLFWWVRSRMRRDAELACDAWAVATASPGERRRFAESLIALAARASAVPFGSPGLAATPRARRLFERRLIMIVDQVPHRIPRWLPLGVFALVGLAFPSWLVLQAQSSTPQDRDFLKPVVDDDRYWTAEARGNVPLGQESTLEVHARVGQLEIVTGQGRDIVITANVRAKKEHVDAAEVRSVFEDHVKVERRDGKLVIKDAHEPEPQPAGEKGRDNVWQVDLRVEVPRALHIVAHSGVGDVRIETGRSVVAHVGVGNVQLRLRDVEKIEGHLGVGDLIIQAGHVNDSSQVDVGTGSVKLTLDSVNADWTVTLGVGDLVMTVPQQVSASFELESGIGTVDVPWGSAEVKKDSLGAKAKIDLGQGARVQAKTGVGSIRVHGS